MAPDGSRLLFGHSLAVASWVAARIGIPAERFHNCEAIGVIRDGECVAGAAFSNFRQMEHGNSVEVSIAGTGVRWCTRIFLRVLAAYAFEQLQCVRLYAIIARNNRRARKFVERLGFKMEGVNRRAYDGRRDSISYSMLPHECKW